MVRHNNTIKTFVSEKLSSCFSLISMNFFFGIWRMFTEASGEHPLMISSQLCRSGGQIVTAISLECTEKEKD